MSAVLQTAVPPASPSEDASIRRALSQQTAGNQPESKNTWAWLWEAIQGDFNEDRSTGQIAFDSAVSMVPLVDQVCDLRDLIANCRAIAISKEGDDNTWKYVGLTLTLLGFFPVLGSALKGVLKICFVFVRRYGLKHLDEALDAAMTWVINYLRKPEVQRYLKHRNVDEVFTWLANGVRELQGRVTTGAVLKEFDGAIALLKNMLAKVTWLPMVGNRAQSTIEMLERVRAKARAPVDAIIDQVKQILLKIAAKLDEQAMLVRHGIVNMNNVHFRGVLPEARAVTLMKRADPKPSWLGKGRVGSFAEQDLEEGRSLVNEVIKRDPEYPKLTEVNIRSFHSMTKWEIKGPAKLYRVVSPTNGAMGDCWVPEDVWQKIMSSPDPKAAWRKYLAVWPDWNPNGQFVVMDVPAGQTIKGWRGPAASQVKDPKMGLDAHLEGGWDQVIIKPEGPDFDTTTFYRRSGAQGTKLERTEMTYADYKALPEAEKAQYAPVRERINHPNIKGPYDTHWGSTDFDAQWTGGRLGLPELPGQMTN
jgi:hypothetical protein